MTCASATKELVATSPISVVVESNLFTATRRRKLRGPSSSASQTSPIAPLPSMRISRYLPANSSVGGATSAVIVVGASALPSGSAGVYDVSLGVRERDYCGQARAEAKGRRVHDETTNEVSESEAM